MTDNRIDVFYHNRLVGTLAMAKDRRIAFQYSREWLSQGFSLNPFSLLLTDNVFLPKFTPFDGLFGVFTDSLPDGWGRLLVDRFLRKNGIDPLSASSLVRLAIVADSGMGALEYKPGMPYNIPISLEDLDILAQECKKILQNQDCRDLDNLFMMGGSSGGARPKILVPVDGEDWIIKFPAAIDKNNIGRQEYEYALCAKECGIQVSEVRLFPSMLNEGYFGTKRFDRNGSEKIFMVSASALLETSHRIPNLDYEILMKLTRLLCKDMSELEKLFKLMCFNVFAHNRDDHSKNFSFLYVEAEKRWILSPAYDLTYSSSLNGEHATTIHGNGVNPGIDDILAVAAVGNIKTLWAMKVARNIQECVSERLGKYLHQI